VSERDAHREREKQCCRAEQAVEATLTLGVYKEVPVELLCKLEEVLRILEVHDAVGLDPLRGAVAGGGGGDHRSGQNKQKIALLLAWQRESLYLDLPAT
jgi:hypothetical protein